MNFNWVQLCDVINHLNIFLVEVTCETNFLFLSVKYLFIVAFPDFMSDLLIPTRTFVRILSSFRKLSERFSVQEVENTRKCMYESFRTRK